MLDQVLMDMTVAEAMFLKLILSTPFEVLISKEICFPKYHSWERWMTFVSHKYQGDTHVLGLQSVLRIC